MVSLRICHLPHSSLIVLVLLILIPSAAGAAGNGVVDREDSSEAQILQIETLLQQLLSSSELELEPVFTDHGGGVFSLSFALPKETCDRLIAALAASDAGDPEAKAKTFLLLAAGQELTEPININGLVHAALSDVDLAYHYWVAAVNLGGNDLTRTTTYKLLGPGRKFNRSFSFFYGAQGIWFYWFNPGRGVGIPGVYTFQAQVSGAGTVTARTVAIRP